MANKTVFQKIDPADVVTLNVEDGMHLGVAVNSACSEIATVLVTEEVDTYNNIRDILSEETTNDLSTVKKGFILPGVSCSADRIKEAAKEHGISITNDFELADFIITDGMVDRDVYGQDNNYPTKSLLVHFQNGYCVYDHYDFISRYHSQTTNSVLWDKRLNEYRNMSNCDYQSLPHDSYIITGLGLKLASLIKQGQMQVIEVDTFLEASANVQPITEQLLEDIRGMLATGDDREVLGAILPTINYRENPALMWQLACLLRGKDYYWNRNKDVKYWWNVANINDLGYMNAEEAVIHYEELGVLDSDNFKMLEPLCRKEISISNRSLYVFKVAVSPKWRKYLTKQK